MNYEAMVYYIRVFVIEVFIDYMIVLEVSFYHFIYRAATY